MAASEWDDEVPSHDFRGKPILKVFIDGKLNRSSGRTGWAIMTPETHQLYGVGLGIGKGQRYIRQPDGRWLKVEG